ncbi:MAG: acetolactate synthase, large subunit, biosynthetic type [Candidatus Melainabacteria bacterium RIFCSPHIGHO2_02_FULL_34_12]|nr:MAG: acetolactate synthase, large subunit, biosynthetic type [Candidatus Melainabacteria bacterium RIFCSPHIGHO2_02_FULL_34_12]
MSEDKINKPGSKQKGSEALLNCLVKEGVKTIFGYPGGAVLGLYDELYKRDDINHILVRHEQSAAFMADGYARITGRPGVVLATSGPGATNIVTGLCSSHMDSIPVIALTGQVPTSAIGKDFFQEADITGITMPIVKHSYLVLTANQIPKTVKKAFLISSTGRPGPTLIDLPKDVLGSTFEYHEGMENKFTLPGYKPTTKGNSRQIHAAGKAILEAKKPMLYIGGGIISSNASEEIKALAENCSIPVTYTVMGKGGFPDSHFLNYGMLGMHGTAYANFAIYNCDLLIAVGVRFDDRVTGKLETFAPNAKVIHIDIDPAEIGKNRKMRDVIDIPIVGDAKSVLIELNEKLAGKKCDTAEWIAQIEDWKKQYPLDIPKDKNQISPQQILLALNKYCKDAIYTVDVGQHQMWAAQYIQLDKPRRWCSSSGLGAMGYGFPAALGAKAAAKDIGLDIPVVAITGDGGFQMNLQELGTMVAHDLPVIIVLFNNNNLGMVRQWQELFYNKHYSYIDWGLGNPDYVKLAEAYGMRGIKIEDPSKVESAIEEAVRLKKPILLEFVLSYEANVWPIVPPGGSNHEMMGISSNTLPQKPATKSELEKYIKR